MGLLSILRKLKEKERQMRILIIGLDNAGKTTVVKRFKNEPTDTISPTLGFNIDTFEYKDFKLNFWDIGGQKSLRAYWKNYFEETDGIIWVVDSTDLSRMDDCKRELDVMLAEDKLAGATLLVLANKQDLQRATSVDKIAAYLRIADVEQRTARVMPCSARTGDGLADAIDWLVDDIASRLFLTSSNLGDQIEGQQLG